MKAKWVHLLKLRIQPSVKDQKLTIFHMLGIANQSCLIAIEQHDPVVWKSCRNIQRLSLSPCDDLNALSVLSRKRFVITKGALGRLLAR
jgi:ribosomal protein L4